MSVFNSRLERVRLLVLDVDGVLTDGSVWIGGSGEEMKRFFIRDGYGIKLLQKLGIEIAVISGRHSEATLTRTRELGIEHVIQGNVDKIPAFEDLLKTLGLQDDEVAFVGDDWMDVPLLQRVGFAAAVADATKEARAVAHYVTVHPGGRGAVREITDMILDAKDPGGDLRQSLGLSGCGNFVP